MNVDAARKGIKRWMAIAPGMFWSKSKIQNNLLKIHTSLFLLTLLIQAQQRSQVSAPDIASQLEIDHLFADAALNDVVLEKEQVEW